MLWFLRHDHAQLLYRHDVGHLTEFPRCSDPEACRGEALRAGQPAVVAVSSSAHTLPCLSVTDLIDCTTSLRLHSVCRGYHMHAGAAISIEPPRAPSCTSQNKDTTTCGAMEASASLYTGKEPSPYGVILCKLVDSPWCSLSLQC